MARPVAAPFSSLEAAPATEFDVEETIGLVVGDDDVDDSTGEAVSGRVVEDLRDCCKYDLMKVYYGIKCEFMMYTLEIKCQIFGEID